MKSELEGFRKYNLQDYLVNVKKYKDYLDYCKKRNLTSEKKSLMESIIKAIQDKTLVQNRTLIENYINLAALEIIFSDFEIELFFEIKNFNPDLQNMILSQTINYNIDRQADSESYIRSKSQFWILKMENYNYISLNKMSNISEEEIKSSTESLKNYIKQENYDKSEDNVFKEMSNLNKNDAQVFKEGNERTVKIY